MGKKIGNSHTFQTYIYNFLVYQKSELSGEKIVYQKSKFPAKKSYKLFFNFQILFHQFPLTLYYRIESQPHHSIIFSLQYRLYQ